MILPRPSMSRLARTKTWWSPCLWEVWRFWGPFCLLPAPRWSLLNAPLPSPRSSTFHVDECCQHDVLHALLGNDHLCVLPYVQTGEWRSPRKCCSWRHRERSRWTTTPFYLFLFYRIFKWRYFTGFGVKDSARPSMVMRRQLSGLPPITMFTEPISLLLNEYSVYTLAGDAVGSVVSPSILVSS